MLSPAPLGPSFPTVLADQTHGSLSHTPCPLLPCLPPTPEPLWGAWPLLYSSVDIPLAPNQSLEDGILPPITLGMLLAHWLHPLIWHLGQSRAGAKPCALGGSCPGTSHQSCPGRAAAQSSLSCPAPCGAQNPRKRQGGGRAGHWWVLLWLGTGTWAPAEWVLGAHVPGKGQ